MLSPGLILRGEELGDVSGRPGANLDILFSLHSTDVPVASMTATALARLHHRKQGPTYAADLVVLVVVLGLLDHVPPHDIVVSVVIVLLVVDKVVLAQEFRLVILEFPDHVDGLSSGFCCWGYWRRVVRTLMNETVDGL
jgi:hypothetical protein